MFQMYERCLASFKMNGTTQEHLNENRETQSGTMGRVEGSYGVKKNKLEAPPAADKLSVRST